MRDLTFRCSSIGKLMTEPIQIDVSLRTLEVEEIIAKKKRSDDEKLLIKSLKERTLSVGAKTYIRELAAQAIFGVDFEVSSKAMEKGIQVEQECIELLNRVRTLDLAKNLERRANEWISGECDLYHATARRGHDIKASWSVATFPIAIEDCEDSLYEWQMRGYMALWDADEWEVNFCLVDTPEKLITYEPLQMHLVGHIPEHHRVTSWTVERDREKEAAMFRKVRVARTYYAQVITEFDRSHPLHHVVAAARRPVPIVAQAAQVIQTAARIPETIDF